MLWVNSGIASSCSTALLCSTVVFCANPFRTKFEKLKDWFKDKWYWLQTFNDVPYVIINCNNISVPEGEEPCIVARGRVEITLNGDLKIIPKQN